ncbi:MAG: hypothetical protein K8R87_09105 [Verrucomicrobia bacterium]|nr:hypothetical protein [Verrucomicrobiota bacterium]
MTKGILKSQLLVVSATLLAGIGIGWVSRDISQPHAPPAVVTKNASETNTARRSQSSSLFPETPAGGESAFGSISKNTAAPSTEEARRAEANGILKRLIAEMEGGDKIDYRQLFKTLGQLRDFGPAGIAAIADYLRSGEDLVVASPGGPGGSRGSTGRSMSLRSMLLNALGDMPPSPELAALNLEVMKGTPLIEEAVLAAYNLQRMAPGEYKNAATERVNWLLENLSSNSAVNNTDAMQRELRYATQFASYTGSAQTLALLSQQVNADPAMARMITSSLRNFPGETQAATLASMTSNPAASKEIASNSRALTRLDLSNNSVRGSVADLFLNQMNDRAREDFLETIARPDQYNGRDGGSRLSYYREPSGGQQASAQPAQNQATLQLLDQIGTAIHTPVLQQRYDEARQALTTTTVAK